MMNKKKKCEKFIQFGERKNGKFKKSEMLSLEEFKIFLNHSRLLYKAPCDSFFCKILGITRRARNRIDRAYEIELNLIDNIIDDLSDFIELDKVGQKTLKICLEKETMSSVKSTNKKVKNK